MYDSILYGNGLTLAVFNLIKEYSKSEFIHYLDCNKFIFELAYAKPHKRILREFLKYFTINKETEITHNKARKLIIENYQEIATLGFERWVSKNLFSNNNYYKQIKDYLYFIYNYWYYIVYETILIKKIPSDIILNIGKIVLDSLVKDTNIFTTNFDTTMDRVLNPFHLHGKFQIPLTNFKDIVAFHVSNKEFEYKYLFGTNGLEKLSRLNEIRKHTISDYDIDFFYNNNIEFGSLLIYGLAFGRTEFLSNDFLTSFPEHKNNKLIGTVDGHILTILLNKYSLNKIQRITITYYNDADKNNYQNLFKDTSVENIINYKHCNEVFNFKDVLIH